MEWNELRIGIEDWLIRSQQLLFMLIHSATTFSGHSAKINPKFKQHSTKFDSRHWIQLLNFEWIDGLISWMMARNYWIQWLPFRFGLLDWCWIQLKFNWSWIKRINLQQQATGIEKPEFRLVWFNGANWFADCLLLFDLPEFHAPNHPSGNQTKQFSNQCAINQLILSVIIAVHTPIVIITDNRYIPALITVLL